MTHVLEQLSALGDGALSDAEARAVRAHLAACASCRVAEARLRPVASLLASLPPPPLPSPDFEARLEARLAALAPARGAPRARRLGWRWRFAIPVAVAAAAAVAVVVTVRHDRARERDVAARLELFEDYVAVASVGEVESAEDAAVIAHLDQLPSGGRR